MCLADQEAKEAELSKVVTEAGDTVQVPVVPSDDEAAALPAEKTADNKPDASGKKEDSPVDVTVDKGKEPEAVEGPDAPKVEKEKAEKSPTKKAVKVTEPEKSSKSPKKA